MKSLFAILAAIPGLLVCSISATALHGDYELSMGSLEVSADNTAVGKLEVTDGGFPGVTFTGTAQSINEQMKALKPKTLHAVDNGGIGQARSLRKRSSTNCNWGGDILGPRSCDDGYSHLKDLGNAKCCRNTPFCASCSDIAKDMAKIIRECKANLGIQTPAGALDFPDHFVGVKSTPSC
ncbi:hypothetical protein DDE82_009026 [Stemphylium lycopersici]|uniref:Secreted protein n=1 Tax=Stemphylium lycopersici TaxID=183478 RepID=A0A364MRI3_STELY|nr:hypothetical protein TW65_06399 [Stemphylium lycopersici]RAQ98667.1 hypothetical protein DDE82_009026 [Stemphylium lycopersici]RAR00392.1 hypothetical protein DDE83_009114 [Stemphylium lycopersici]